MEPYGNNHLVSSVGSSRAKTRSELRASLVTVNSSGQENVRKNACKRMMYPDFPGYNDCSKEMNASYRNNSQEKCHPEQTTPGDGVAPLLNLLS
jgi:membrane-bound lytic murein transglycosylase MltF